MTNPTPEIQVDQAVHGVVVDVQQLAVLAARWPDLVQEQLRDIEFARAKLALIATCLKDWQETQKQVGPVDFLGAG